MDNYGGNDERLSRNSPQEDRRSPRREARSPSPRRDPSPRGSEGDTLFVSRLAPATNSQDVEEKFGKFGKILSCKLMKEPRTGESRGFAFIKYENANDATEALRAMDGAEVDGRPIAVEKAKRDKPRSPTPGQYLGRNRRDFGGSGRDRGYERRDYDRGYGGRDRGYGGGGYGGDRGDRGGYSPTYGGNGGGYGPSYGGDRGYSGGDRGGYRPSPYDRPSYGGDRGYDRRRSPPRGGGRYEDRAYPPPRREEFNDRERYSRRSRSPPPPNF